MFETILALVFKSETWVIILGVVAIFATVVSPRLGRRGKLGVAIDRLIPVRQSTKHAKVSVSYSIDGDVIEDDIYVVEGEIKNIGSKDIRTSHFEHPITVEAPDYCRFLSLDMNASMPVETQFDKGSNKFCLQWPLMKKGEGIKFSAICAVNKEKELQEKDISIEGRLVDIDTKGLSAPVIFPILIMYVVVTAFAYVPLVFDTTGRSFFYLESETGSGPIRFDDSFEKYQICNEQSTKYILRDCSEMRSFEGPFADNVQLKSTFIGVHWLYLVFPPIFALLYMIPIFFTWRKRNGFSIGFSIGDASVSQIRRSAFND